METINRPNKKIKLMSILVLSLLLWLIASKHLNLHRNPPPLVNTDAKIWLQPSEINSQYPNLISNNTWSLSFTSIERIIKSIKSDSNKNLIINSDLTEKVPQILFQLDKKPESTQWQRLEFLLIKSLGEKPGKEFYQLISNYYHYEKEYIAYSNKINLAKSQEKRALLKNSMNVLTSMQARHFKKDTAIKLFENKNKTTHYLNSIRIVNLDQTLSKAQKKQRLSRLSKDYKLSLSQR